MCCAPILRPSLPAFVPDVSHPPAAEEERIRLSGRAQIVRRLFPEVDPAVEMPVGQATGRAMLLGRPPGGPAFTPESDCVFMCETSWRPSRDHRESDDGAVQ